MAEREPGLGEDVVRERLRALPGWFLHDGTIRRIYDTDGWPATMLTVNAIAFVAEAADHHPDLIVTWSSVTVALSTHSARGITGKDFDLARRIEDVLLWRPAPDGALGARPRQPALVRGRTSSPDAPSTS